MSALADVQGLTTQWKNKYGWSEEEHVDNYLELIGCLEWNAYWGNIPKNSEGMTDWEELEKLEREAARESLGYK